MDSSIESALTAVRDVISMVSPVMASERARNILQGLAFSDEIGLEPQFIVYSGLKELNQDRGFGTKSLNLSEGQLVSMTDQILTLVASFDFSSFSS